MRRASLSLWVVLLLCVLSVSPVHAGTCSNPTGNEADRIYNGTYHTYQFCNGTNWMSEGAIGSTGGLTLISTQAASSSASLQFTSLPTSYNTLFLNCAGLLASAGGTLLFIEVGEGAGPTWETGAHYTASGWYVGNGAVTGFYSTTGTDLTGGGWGHLQSTAPVSFKMWIDNVSSSNLYKNARMDVEYLDGNDGLYYEQDQAGYWNNDTNPITGIEVTMTGGTITSGTCTLYGMN